MSQKTSFSHYFRLFFASFHHCFLLIARYYTVNNSVNLSKMNSEIITKKFKTVSKMKLKFFIFSLFIIGNVWSICAQNTFQKERAIGISGGVNFSKVNFMPKVQQEMYMGMHAGVMARWRTEKNLGLQVELNFKQQGWDEKYEGDEYAGLYYRRRMNYMEVPFLSHIYFGGKTVQFFINLGPQIGIMLSDKTDENLNGRKTPQNIEKQHTRDIDNPLEWGLCGGPGIELRTGIGSFLLEGRFYYSFGDFYKTRKDDDFDKASSQVISAKLTYLIPF